MHASEKQFTISVVIFILLGFYPLFAEAFSIPYSYQIIAKSPKEMTVKFVYHFPQKISEKWVNDYAKAHFLYDSEKTIPIPETILPFISFMEHPSVVVIRFRKRSFQLKENLFIPAEFAVGGGSKEISKNACRVLSSQNRPEWAAVKQSGKFREFPLWTLNISPVQIDPDQNNISVFDTLWVKLKFAAAFLQKAPLYQMENEQVVKTLKQRILNKEVLKNITVHRAVTGFAKPLINLNDRQMIGFKILIEKQGWYKITYDFLKANKIPIGKVAWNRIKIIAKKNPVPFVAHGLSDGTFDPGDGFEFWGEPNYNTRYPGADDMYYDPYSLENAYEVTWNGLSGKTYGMENGGYFSEETTTVFRPRNFMTTVHQEKENMYSRLSRMTPGMNQDHWFYGSVGAGEIQNYPIDLPAPDTYSNRLVKVRLMLHGQSYGHHSVRAFLSNHRILQGDWYGQTKYAVETSAEEGVFGGQLDQEKNELTLLNDSNDELDFFLLNWFEVTYPRLYKAVNNYIKFTKPDDWPAGRFRFAIDGFTQPDIEVFKINQTQIFGGRVEEVMDSLQQKSFRITFEDDLLSGKTAYIALTPDAKLEPEKADLMYQSDLKRTDNQADYLIIAHPYFAENEELEKLIQLRRSQGLSVKMALTDEIYDLFSDGEKSPVGIKNFLTYAYKNWKKPAPLYVLLVGDGNYLVRNKRAQRVNFIPVYHYQTLKFGAAASDTWYALISGNDLIPDYYIGRLPARTNETLNNILEKILDYETHPSNGEWRNRLLMIAGQGKYFHDQNTELAGKYLPQNYLVQKFYTSPMSDPFYGDTQKLLTYFNKGVSYANFMGHGGGAVWADNLLFRFDDLKLLRNAPGYPIVSSMTCFTGAFDSPGEVSCLGEQMLKLDHQGAAAFLGASGIGWVWNDYYLLQQLIDHLFVHPAATIGEAVTFAKIDYQAKYFTLQRESMVHQYNLLGDPALHLVFPKDSLKIEMVRKGISPGDSLQVKLTAPIENGRLSIALIDSIGLVVKSDEIPYRSNPQWIRISVPETSHPGLYRLKFDLYPDAGRVNYHGSVPVAVGQFAVVSIHQMPRTVIVGDSVTIQAEVVSLPENSEVFCVFESPVKDSLKMALNPVTNAFGTTRPMVFKRTGRVLYHLSILTPGKRVQSSAQSFRVNAPGDLRIQPQSIRVAVDDRIRLAAVVRNIGITAFKNITISFRQILDTDSIFLGKTQIDLSSYETATVNVPVILPPGRITIRATVDPENRIREKNEANNSTQSTLETPAFYFVPGKGFLEGSGKTDSVCVRNGISVVVPPKSQSVPFVLSFENEPWSRYKTGQMVQVVKPEKWKTPVLVLKDNPHVEMSAGLRIVPGDSIVNRLSDNLSLFRFYPEEKTWAKVLNTSLKDSVLAARTDGFGAFAFLKNRDRMPPEIKISINKRAFYDGGDAGENPKFTIEIRDANGVHPNPTAQKIFMDGSPINRQQSEFRQNFGADNLILTLSPELSPGDHQLSVRGMDCMGNVSEVKSVRFKIAADFDLKVLGNYPNPFRDQTVFAYELTAQAEDISLKIFTVSGRLVRRFEALDFLDDPDPLEPGYHELTWDGTDGNGEDVANGVYYFKFTVKDNRKKIEKIGKIARIK